MIVLALTAVALAADQKFRADGKIQRISSDRVLLRMPTQDMEFARDAKTKVTGQLVRGAAATVYYSKVAGQDYATEIVMGGAPKAK